MRLARAKEHVLNYVRHEFRCSGCEARDQMPKPALPASLPKNFRFNETVGIDLIELDRADGNGKFYGVNMVCWGTLFQLVFETPDKRPETVAAIFADKWTRYFGPPLVLIADQGREFVGQPFFDMCVKYSILLHVTNVRAPWEKLIENARLQEIGFRRCLRDITLSTSLCRIHPNEIDHNFFSFRIIQ